MAEMLELSDHEFKPTNMQIQIENGSREMEIQKKNKKEMLGIKKTKNSILEISA